ncbi:ZIP family metal transporter [Stratiformator vulcanicus]|uniref:Zinc transporter ZupT n=1 Tax=Stratiformator vulcanicus TaxID=2527980 RepID=A0A517R0Z3_9PLAN|nr:ZIP family metal transporter [Stratiformator vulcanicus]QDT37567.1 zinc transporter ZupT [Stratiformator vulcanicus]
MDHWSVAVIYGATIAVLSFCGGALPSFVRISHTRMQIIMSAVGGLMLGVALFQLWPHSFALIGRADRVGIGVACGLVTLFVLMRAFHFHTHEIAVDDTEDPHAHDHDGGLEGHHCDPRALSDSSWAGMLFGLSVHSLIDGVALGAAVRAASGSAVWMAALGTFIAIAAHKPLDALSIRSLMLASGRSAKSQLIVNLLYAVICPLGAFAFLAGVTSNGETTQLVTGYALAFSAGVFLCISLSDVLPELEFHSHDRIKLTLALIGGVLVAYAIEYFAHGSHAAGASAEVVFGA